MRFSAEESQTIIEEIRRVDAAAEIYLYGSRVDDSAKGGDIDLLIISDRIAFRDVLNLRCRILDRIGWQQMDLLVRRTDQADEPANVQLIMPANFYPLEATPGWQRLTEALRLLIFSNSWN